MRIFWLIISLLLTNTIIAQNSDHLLFPRYSQTEQTSLEKYYIESKNIGYQFGRYKRSQQSEINSDPNCIACSICELSTTVLPDWEHTIERWEADAESYAYGHAILPGGSIVTTGNAIRSRHHADMLTVCLDQNGSVNWTDYYDGPMNGDDVGNNVVYGDNGKIYVYGISYGGSGLYESVVLQYSPDGTREWEYRDSGNKGNSSAIWDVKQRLLIQNGVLRLILPYKHGIRVIFLTETGQALTEYTIIDEDGFRLNLNGAFLNSNNDLLLLCQRDMHGYQYSGLDDTAWAHDILIQKIDPSGNLLWEYEERAPANNRFNVTSAVCDSLGNIYFSGSYETSFDNTEPWHLFIRKVASTGDRAWNFTLLEDSISYYEHTSLTLSPQNQLVFTTEASWDVVKDNGVICYTLDLDGTEINRVFLKVNNDQHEVLVDEDQNIWLYSWRSLYKFSKGGESIFARPDYMLDIQVAQFSLNSLNQFIVSGQTFHWDDRNEGQFVTAQYDSRGELLWSYSHDSDNTVLGSANALQSTGNGNLIVGGFINGKAIIQKMDRIGNVHWSREEKIQLQDEFYANSSSLQDDAIGNIYSLMNQYLIKYKPTGLVEWRNNIQETTRSLFPTLEIGWIGIRHLDVDHGGNVTICGIMDHKIVVEGEEWNNDDIFIFRLNSEGNSVWEKRFDTGFRWSPSDLPYRMRLDEDGNIYVATKNLDEGGSPAVKHLLAIDSQGNLMWKKNLTKLGMYKPEDMCVNKDNQIVLTGSVLDGGGLYKFMNIKFNSNGDIVWKRMESLPGLGEPSSLRLTTSGDILWSGDFENKIPNSGGRWSCSGLLIKFNAAGNRLWEKQIPEMCWGIPIELDPEGNIFTWTFGNTPMIIGYDPFGNEIFRTHYSDSKSGIVRFNDVVIDPYGDLTVAASVESFGPSHWSKFRVLHYDLGPAQGAYSVPVLTLRQNHPNPFSQNTTISINLSEPADVKLTVFNSIGQEVERKKINDQPAGEYEFNLPAKGLANGIYLYRVEAGGEAETRKMVRVR